MKRRTLVITLLALVVLAGGGYGLYRLLAPRPEGEPTQAIVRRGTIAASINALGKVQPKHLLSLSTRASGTVQRILVEPGQVVEQGALLLELDAHEYEQAVAQAERSLQVRRLQLEEALKAPDSAAIDLVRAHLRVATAARLKAQKDYDKVAQQPDAESSTEAVELERAKLDYDLAKADFDRTMQGASALDLERLRADVADGELALRQSQERLGQTRIVAPSAGTILDITPQVGENVYGSNPLIRMANLRELEIVAEIDEIDIAKVAEGQRVQIRLDAFPAQIIEGQIARVLPGIGETRGTTTYQALIDLDAPDLPVRPGMGANLTVTTQQAEDVLLIPKRALRQAGRHQVVRVIAGGHAKEVIVTTGLSNDSEVEILVGLEEGQVVALN